MAWARPCNVTQRIFSRSDMLHDAKQAESFLFMFSCASEGARKHSPFQNHPDAALLLPLSLPHRSGLSPKTHPLESRRCLTTKHGRGGRGVRAARKHSPFQNHPDAALLLPLTSMPGVHLHQKSPQKRASPVPPQGGGLGREPAHKLRFMLPPILARLPQQAIDSPRMTNVIF